MLLLVMITTRTTHHRVSQPTEIFYLALVSSYDAAGRYGGCTVKSLEALTKFMHRMRIFGDINIKAEMSPSLDVDKF